MDGKQQQVLTEWSDSRPTSDPVRQDPRSMVRGELLGQHSHQTICGKNIHIWQRAGKFIARGYINGKRFGETLGTDKNDATARLRRLMVDIENRAYLRPSEKLERPLARDVTPRLSLRQVVDDFLQDKRKTTGSKTANTYLTRLVPLVEFAELPEVRRTSQLAQDIDRNFAVEFRVFLHRRVTRDSKAPVTEWPGYFNCGKGGVRLSSPISRRGM